MGKPMEWVHADGSVTVGVSQATFGFCAIEQHINRMHFWPEGHRDYAVVLSQETPQDDASWDVKRIGDPEALIPADVREAAETAVAEYLGRRKQEEEHRMNLAAAPHFLADAVESLDLAAEWEVEGSGCSVVLADLVAGVETYDGVTWHGWAYPALKPTDRFAFESTNLADVFDAVETWMAERLI